MALFRRYQRGEKSTDLEVGSPHLVYRRGKWWASWVWNEEKDRLDAPAIRERYAEFKRLMGSSRSS